MAGAAAESTYVGSADREEMDLDLLTAAAVMRADADADADADAGDRPMAVVAVFACVHAHA